MFCCGKKDKSDSKEDEESRGLILPGDVGGGGGTNNDSMSLLGTWVLDRCESEGSDDEESPKEIFEFTNDGLNMMIKLFGAVGCQNPFFDIKLEAT